VGSSIVGVPSASVGSQCSGRASCRDPEAAEIKLRPSVAAAFGFDPFERVVDYLERQLVASPA